jgi:small subunit ribosomal protein S16
MRMGKKKQPTYRVVAADSRSPRDGRFIEIVGVYDPRPDPSAIRIDNDKAVDWLRKGAQPTESVRKLLEISGAWETFSGEAPSRPAPEPAAAPASEAPASKAPAESAASKAPAKSAAKKAADTTEVAPDEGAADSADAAADESAAGDESAAADESAAGDESADATTDESAAGDESADATTDETAGEEG